MPDLGGSIPLTAGKQTLGTQASGREDGTEAHVTNPRPEGSAPPPRNGLSGQAGREDPVGTREAVCLMGPSVP